MSPAGQALQARFDEVCRSELRRLHKKTASLAPEHRADVHALTLELVERIALRLDAALTSNGGGDAETIVMRLFAVTARNAGDR